MPKIADMIQMVVRTVQDDKETALYWLNELDKNVRSDLRAGQKMDQSISDRFMCSDLNALLDRMATMAHHEIDQRVLADLQVLIPIIRNKILK